MSIRADLEWARRWFEEGRFELAPADRQRYPEKHGLTACSIRHP